MRKSFGLFLTLLFFGVAVNAQKFNYESGKKWYVTAHGGHIKAHTDVNQYDLFPGNHNLEWSNWAGGLNLGREIFPFLDLGVGATYGSLGGKRSTTYYDLFDNLSKDPKEDTRQERSLASGLNQKFDGEFFQYQGNAKFYPLPLFYPYSSKMNKKWAPYLTAGLGVTNFRSIRSGLYDNRFIAQEGYDRASFVEGGSGVDLDSDDGEWTHEIIIPVGLGLRYNVFKSLDLGLEYVLNNPLSDKIDALERGQKNDNYQYLNFNVSYFFGKGSSKPNHLANSFSSIDSKIEEAVAKATAAEEKSNAVEESLNDLTTEVEGIKTDVDANSSAIDGISSRDSDGDGIVDIKDLEPYSAKGAKVNGDGITISVDSDGDGVADYMDKEPNTRAGALVNFQGIEIKTGQLSSNGRIVSYSVFFDTNKYNVKSSEYVKILEAVRVLQADPSSTAVLTGFADVRGSEPYNLNLSKNRVDEVLELLSRDFGIAKERLSIEAKGESEQIGSDTLYQLNRRVDIMIK